ncbi:MAG: c-type cytochrome [Acidobacteria bacterium]|nr:c-type cytochrome [Acidobacteriota bacterium]
MRFRDWWIWFAAAACVWPPVWAMKPGEAAPDLALRDRSGTEVRLSAYRQKKHVLLLTQAPAAAVLDDTCRRLAALDAVVLFLAGDTEANRKFLEGAPSATALIDSGGVVRRVLPGLVLTGPDLAGFVGRWQSGKAVFKAACARCHGEEGDLHICEDVKPLEGIGKRLTPVQIRERLRIGEVNDREVLIRGQIFNRQEVEEVIVYVASL